MPLPSLNDIAPGVPSTVPSQSLDISDPFLRSFAHDLRSPLFAILGYLQLLEKHVKGRADPEKTLEYLRLARESGLRLDLMVTEMLDLARFGSRTASMEKEDVSVGNLFRRLWRTFHGIAQEKKISLRLMIKDDEALKVSADPKYLERALDNLIGNAIKFNLPEGDVAVTAMRQGGRIIFQISDTGLGVPREAEARIFEPFSQIRASDRSMGFGLGLPIVKFIAKAHGGDVELIPQPGPGSCFALWLPE